MARFQGAMLVQCMIEKVCRHWLRCIPSPGATTGGNPTGVVLNASNTDFILSNGVAGRFIFVGVDGIFRVGTVVQEHCFTNPKQFSYVGVYGLALASDGGANFLYAANFGARTIDVFDRLFVKVSTKPFVDPYLPAGYSPFNIQLVGDKLYVAYAKVGPDGRDLKGVGNGIVNVFSTNGTLLKRFAEKGKLNSPWGVAWHPRAFSKAILAKRYTHRKLWRWTY